MRYVDHMTNPTTSQTLEASAVSHLDADLDVALELLIGGGISASLICDGSCRGTASCCIAPVAAETAALAA